MIKNTVDFTVNVKGDLTGTEFLGTFTAKTKLSMRESLRQDETYRSVLGVSPQDASLDSKRIASAVSYLAMHIIKGPDWWPALENGLKVEDINVLAEFNNKCQDAIDAEYKKLSEEATAAETVLKASNSP